MKKILFSFVLLVLSTTLSAQSSSSTQLSGFMGQGELLEDMPNLWGFGFSLEHIEQYRPAVSLGFRLGGFTQVEGIQEKRDMWLGPELGDQRVKWKNHVANLLGFVRYKPRLKSPVRPYLDFTAGLTMFWTAASSKDILEGLPEVIPEDHNIDDCPHLGEDRRSLARMASASWNYGIGGGVEISIGDGFMVDVGVLPLQGTPADVLIHDAGENTRVRESDGLLVRRASMDYLTFNISVRMLISPDDF